MDPFGAIVGLNCAPTPRRCHGIAGGSSATSNDDQVVTFVTYRHRGVDEPVETSRERHVTNIGAGQ